MKTRGKYNKGKKEGRWSEWYDNEKLMYSFTYKNDILNGKCIERYKNGGKKSEILYRDGVKSGVDRFWTTEGLPLYDFRWKEGLKDGIQTEWSNKGLIKYKHSYSNNILHGDFVEYFKGGQESIVGKYKTGKKHGEWTWNYQDGLVALSGNYKNDNPIKTWYWIRANKSEMVNTNKPNLDWVNKRIREWEKINDQ